MLREGVVDDLYIDTLPQQIVNIKKTLKSQIPSSLQGHSGCSLSTIVASVDLSIRPTTSNKPMDILPQVHLSLCTSETRPDQFSQLILVRGEEYLPRPKDKMMRA